MLTKETNSSSVEKKSKLSLSLRSLNLLNCTANSTHRQSNQALVHNQITNGSVEVEPDDNLDDFKSPQKFDVCPKKVKRKDVRPYRRPGDTTCTQDIIVDAYKKAKENFTDYQSEDEFVIFQKFKKTKKEEKNCADEEEVRKDQESSDTTETKSAESVLPMISTDPINKANKCNSNKNLRSELKDVKINNVIIEDSEDEVIPCSQKVVRKNIFKPVNNHTAKVETLTNIKNENADSNSLMRSGIFWNDSCSIRLLYSAQETDDGTVYFIPKQDCLPIPILVSDQGTTHVQKVDNDKALKEEVLNKDNICVNSKNNNIVHEQNDKLSNSISLMSLHDVVGNNEKSKRVDSALEQSYGQMSELQGLEVVGKNSQSSWDEIQMSEEIFYLQPSQSNETQFKRISKGLSSSRGDETDTTTTPKSNSRFFTQKKFGLKKEQCKYIRKLWWRSKYLKRKCKVLKVGMTRSGIRFRSI